MQVCGWAASCKKVLNVLIHCLKEVGLAGPSFGRKFSEILEENSKIQDTGQNC